MEYKPTVDQSFVHQGIAYRFLEESTNPGKPCTRLGRSGTVYKVQAKNGDIFALKVFLQPFRLPRLADGCDRLKPYVSFPGLQVCSRSALTSQNNPGLVLQYENLAYAVLMPWINGETWQDFKLSGTPLNQDQSRALARSLAHALTRMEKASLAHCDLSGSNLMLPGLIPLSQRAQTPNQDSSLIALVDIEDIFTPNLSTPEKLSYGSKGYAHRTGSQGIWIPEGDRFAGAILLAEILGWCDENIPKLANGDQFFSDDEIQQDCDRFKAIFQSLELKWGREIANLFQQCWDSYTLADCPPLAEWSRFLGSPQPGDETLVENISASRGDKPMNFNPTGEDARLRQARVAIERAEVWQQMGQTDKALQELEEAYRLSPAVTGSPLATLLRRRAEGKERSGDLQNALRDYQRALEIAPPGKLRDELSGIVSEVDEKIQKDKRTPQTMRCPTCQRNIPLGASVCPLCGANLSQKTVAVSRNAAFPSVMTPQYPIVSPTSAQQVYEPYPAEVIQPPPKKFPIWIPILGIGLLLLCGLSIGAFFIIGPGSSMLFPAETNTPIVNISQTPESPKSPTNPPVFTQSVGATVAPTLPNVPTQNPATIAPTRSITNTIIPTPVPTKPLIVPTPKGALFFDDFATKAKTWDENSEKGWSSGYADNGYFISSNIPEGFYYVLAPMTNQPNRTLTIQVKVRPDPKLADKGEFGIIGHFTNNKNYYRFGISLANGGQYYLGRRLGGNYEYIKTGPWKTTNRLKPGEFNTITLAFTADRIIIKINDNPVEDIRDAYTFTGPAGIFIISHNTDQNTGNLYKAQFDDFAVIAE